MQTNKVMINPARPLVIYKSMQVNLIDSASEILSRAATNELLLELSSSSMQIDGKKATATLEFELSAAGSKVGDGNKIMLLGGLREYDQQAIDEIVLQYNSWKQDYVVPS